jgi:YVTN family beta-propeller protein
VVKRGFVIAKTRVLLMAVCLSGAGLVSQSATAQTTGGALLVLNKDENALAIVDPETGKTVGRVPTGEGPHEIVASSDGKFAFVTNYGEREGGTTLSMIDLAAQKETRRVALGALRRPHGAIFADGKVYFTAEANKLIARYDPAADRVDWMMGTGQEYTHMLVASKDLRQIFTANIGSDSVTAIERSADGNGWKETQIAVGKGPEGIDISPDGKEVWAANSESGSISIIDAATHKVVQTLDVKTKHSNRLKFTLDGTLALVSDAGNDDVVVVEAASRKEIKRIKVGRVPLGILMEPGGARAYVAASEDQSVAVIDLKTLQVTKHIAAGKGVDGLAWSVAR